MGREIKNTIPPSLYGQPSVQFRPNDFDAAIYSHGYDIICEKAIRCPCQGNSGAPLPDCQNCHGFGYFYINPTRTKAIVSGLNKSTQFVQWSPELMGTSSITVRDSDKELLSFFDRVTIEDEYAQFTEMVVGRRFTDDQQGIFLSYAPIEIKSVWLFEDSNAPLIRVEKRYYEVSPTNPYCIIFKSDFDRDISNVGISVLYNHRVEYHVIDLPHEIRASLGKDKMTGQYQVLKMPVQVIGRRTHLIDMAKPDYGGSGLIHNDYDTDTFRPE